MSATRTPPTRDELLAALASALASGASPPAALAWLAGAGPASARVARQLEEGLKSGSLSSALTSAGLVAADEAAVVAAGDASAALAWTVDWRRIRAERRRAIRGAVIGPLAFAALTLLAEPLPSLVMGAGLFGGALRATLLLAAATAALWFGVPRLLVRRRAWFARVPFVGALLRLDEEDAAAALVAAFAARDNLGAAPSVARAIAAPFAESLIAAAADPSLRAPSLSESFALALSVGARQGELPARMAAFHADRARTLTARLRRVARVVAFAVAAAVAVQATSHLLSGPLPGLGGNVDTPEMRELERELDSINH